MTVLSTLSHWVFRALSAYIALRFTFYLFYGHFISPLRKLPGTPLHSILAPILPFLRALQGKGGHDFMSFDRTHKKYGGIVRMSNRTISIADPSIARDVTITKDLPKSWMYELFKPANTDQNIFNTRDPVYHKKMRKIMSPSFGLKYIESLEIFLFKVLDDLFRKFDKTIESSTDGTGVADIWKDMHFFTAEVMGETAFGQSFGLVKSGKSEIVEALEDIFRYVAITALFAFLRPFTFIPAMHRLAKAELKVHNSMKQVMEKRTKSSGKRVDILQSLIDARRDDGKPLAEMEIIDHATMFLAAGSDTSSNTMSFLIIHLLKNPRAYQVLIKEIMSVPLQGNYFSSASIVKSIPYMDAVIKETMRLQPAGVGLIRETSQDTVLGGYLIPPKTDVIVAIYSLHHSSDFWKDPEEYRPERFLPGGEAAESEKYPAYFPFSHGSRNCIGKNFALAEMRVYLANFLRRYEIIDIQPNQNLETDSFITLQLVDSSYMIGIRKRS